MAKSLKATDMDGMCETDECRQTHHPHRFPVGSGPFCEECINSSIWAADDAEKQKLLIYPSRTNGNKTTEEIDAMARDPHAPPLRKALLAGQRERDLTLVGELIDRKYLEAHLAHLATMAEQQSS